MSTSPFCGWIPGVLSKSQVNRLASEGYIQGLINPKLIDYSSFDLTLTNEGYLMTQGAIKPFGDYELFLRDLTRAGVAVLLKSNGHGAYELKEKQTYVFRLEQQLGPKIRKSSFYGQATAKSSVGRVDVLARLIVDGMDIYEGFTPQGAANGNGHMFLEITPITFPVLVKPGISLSQLRLFFGKPTDCEVTGKELPESVLLNGEGDGSLSVDITDTTVGSVTGCAYRAQFDGAMPPVPLWEDKANPSPKPDPQKYWQVEKAKEIAGVGCVQISKESFYILRSKELIALPSGVAVYCRAIDETLGEMRIHYAGFVHPFFGKDRSDKQVGTPLIFEVRGHDVGVVLKDGEKLAKLTFYRMAQDCQQEGTSDYGEQTLELSKFFAKWK